MELRVLRYFLTDEWILLRKRTEEIVRMVDKLEAEFSFMEETISGDVFIEGGKQMPWDRLQE